MARQPLLPWVIGFVCGVSALRSASGLTIVIDYSHDVAAMNFFSLRPLAKAAVDAAAADLSALLAPTHLSAIGPTGTPNVNLISGVNGITHVDADWDLTYSNPSTGADVTLVSPSLAADTLTVYAGLRPIGVSVLGAGSPGGGSLSLTVSGQGSQLAGAVANLQAASNPYMGRGAGPVVNTFSGTVSLGGSSVPVALILGGTLGSLSFNNDFDNNGATDSLTTFDSLWHYDPSTPVAAGKNDFYSVALHEMMHALGVGDSDTWFAKVSGTTWLGTNASALNGGSGANLIDADGVHLKSGLMSTSLYTGLAQEVALDPTLFTGTRKRLTAMDAAVLQDLGFSVAPVPEPGSALLLACAAGGILARRRRVR